MGDLSANFSRWEMKCKCGACKCDSMDAETLVVVEDVRAKFGHARVDISSAHRCPAHNAAEGGSDGSMHLYARALDFTVEGVDPGYVYEYLDKKYPNKYGIGKYDTFTHLDTRREKARW